MFSLRLQYNKFTAALSRYIFLPEKLFVHWVFIFVSWVTCSAIKMGVPWK